MNDSRRNDFLRRREDRRRGRDNRMQGGRRDYMSDRRNPYGSRGGYVDSRNPYGSRGGYVDSRRGRDYAMGDRNYDAEHNRGGFGSHDIRPYDSRADYHREQYREHSRPAEFEIYGVGGMRPRDYAGSDYRRDYNSDYRNDYNSDYRSDYNSDYRGDYNDYADYGDYAGADMQKQYEEELHKWIEKLKSKSSHFKVSKEQVLQQAKNMGVKFEEFDEEEFYAIYLMHVSDYPTISNEYNIYIRMAKDWLEDKDIPITPSEKVCKYLYNIVLGED